MNEHFLLDNETSKAVYNSISSLPIIDYHCHLSTKEIFEDNPFSDIGEIFLSHDHYKWRLMRCAGIFEEKITGKASFYQKFINFAKSLEFSAGNPLYHWTHMELKKYFNIDTPLTEQTADEIYNKANNVIKSTNMSPRKLIEKSNVKYIATTDDITDDLFYHKKLSQDNSFKAVIAPSFRTDNLLLIYRNNYKDYIETLSKVSKIEICNLKTLKQAVSKRLDYFVSNNCKFTDIGIPFFPDFVASDKESEITFKKAVANETINDNDYSGFLGNMFLFLGSEYKKRGLVSQWHLAVLRNSNAKLFESIGADCGADCIGDAIEGSKIAKMLNKMNSENSLPKTIIYTLNPSLTSQLASVSGAFSNVKIGAAWWFCDNKRGIKETMNVIAEIGHIGSFLGMLTDSRSFLSYARHDYFRRILSNLIAEWVENEDYPLESAKKLAEKIAYKNISEMIGDNL